MQRLKLSLVAIAVATALTACNSSNNNDNTTSSTGSTTTKSFKAVEFTNTPVATTADTIGKTYTSSVAKVTYSDGSTQDFPLSYNKLFGVKDKVGGNAHAAGQLYNYQMEALNDPFGKPVIAETPDSNSLMKVGSNLFLVTHYEYDWLLSDGNDISKAANWYARMPMSMTLTGLTQGADGKLSVKSQKPIDFSAVSGLWIPCNGSLSPWNTHLGSEEDYDLQYNPLNTSTSAGYALTVDGLKSLTNVYFKGEKTATPYNYGIVPEVTVKEDGSTSVVKHYSMGRITRELAKVMPDGKTVYSGDDGTYGMMLMYVADKAGDLSSGTLYAAKWVQTDANGGGKANLTWIKLGSASDAEIKALADVTTFDTIFDNVAATNNTCPSGYTRIRAGSAVDECLKLKAGQEKAAAFLETRRYAALQGATTEFTKMEGLAINAADKKLYMAMSAIRESMLDDATEPMNDIKLKKISSGATYTLDLTNGQKDKAGGAINSDYVANLMYVEPALLGEDMSADAFGNTANVDKIANTDNLFFAERMRTLFIGEDSGMHVNNYVWAYNVDTKKLTRILSAIVGAENTGLQVVESLGNYAYIMSNNQHHGDWSTGKNAEVDKALATIDKFDADIGYIGGLPAFQ